MKKVRRLFRQFHPEHYDLTLDIDPQEARFEGTVTISGQKIGRPSNRLTFHQKGLTITSAQVIRHDRKGEQKLEVNRINHHNGLDEVRLHSQQALYPGNYTVKLSFKGLITRPMDGIYPCFFEHEGKQKQLIATQFESHHAREVFPCIDEPEAKATFQLTLTTPADETVISNTPAEKSIVTSHQPPVEGQKTNDKQLVTTFEKTPKMSTYLLAFVTGELKYKEARTRQGVVVRAYATPDNVQFTDFALDTAVKCLEFYNDYFAIDYPLPKCDLIALPDFASGAMENWGCITFREQGLLVDPTNTSLPTKQYVAMVVAHELAHQWFGNLVTMRWWTDLWLNEGFASWIEFLAVDHLFPDWEMWTQFIVDEQEQALKLDALEHTHAIEAPINHPDDIRTIFDGISYSKGSSAIHMLYQFIGPDAFQTGLRYYLKQHAYGNTDTVDLWAALETASEKPITDFMQVWITQPGFPLVQATIAADTLSLAQERFFTNPEHSELSAQLWPIPLEVQLGSVPETLDAARLELKISDTSELKLNHDRSGFYRVAYNASHLERLGELMSEGKLTPLDRLGILSDLAETARAGKTSSTDTLHFLHHFVQEDSMVVWDTISSIVGSLRLVMDDEELRDSMKPFIRSLVALQLKRLGWDRQIDESHFDRLLRPLILGLAASADEPVIVRKCLELFREIEHAEEIAPDLQVALSNHNIRRGVDIDPDLRGVVFGTAARLGGPSEFDKLLHLHNTATLSEERVTLSAALTAFKQPELVARALSLIDTDMVRLQDAVYWIVYSFLNRHAKQQTWEWMTAHWKWLVKNLGTDLSFARIPVYAARGFSDHAFLEDYKKFFTSVMSPVLERSYKQGTEIIQLQSAWKARDLATLKAFFKQ